MLTITEAFLVAAASFLQAFEVHCRKMRMLSATQKAYEHLVNLALRIAGPPPAADAVDKKKILGEFFLQVRVAAFLKQMSVCFESLNRPDVPVGKFTAGQCHSHCQIAHHSRQVKRLEWQWHQLSPACNPSLHRL